MIKNTPKTITPQVLFIYCKNNRNRKVCKTWIVKCDNRIYNVINGFLVNLWISTKKYETFLSKVCVGVHFSICLVWIVERSLSHLLYIVGQYKFYYSKHTQIKFPYISANSFVYTIFQDIQSPFTGSDFGALMFRQFYLRILITMVTW